MSYFILHTYNNIEEWKKMLKQQDEIIPFIFAETKDLLEFDADICIDISTLIHYLRVNKSDRYPAYLNLKKMTEETIMIVDKSLADDAIRYFPYLFSNHAPLYEEESKHNNPKGAKVAFTHKRRPIYTYHNVNDLTTIISYASTHNIPIVTFSSTSGDYRSELEKLNNSAELALLDLTSTAYAIEDNKNLIYSLEMFLNQFQNIRIIILTSQVDIIMKYFPLYIERTESIKDLLPDLNCIDLVESLNDEVKKVTSLSTSEFNTFIENFNNNLIGHKYFKERFKYILKNFIGLNKIKEQKILSIFLFGASGIGKTEVARLISNELQQDSYLAKINFQNYSSQDALNSLIGSPAGYKGCEGGELNDKINRSEVGIVLCDEFEKTTIPVSSFFLELLEEGKFTDSLAREYDLDGYIFIFTSNILSEHEYQTSIPRELQTRFDLVCEFQEQSYIEKTRFLDLLLGRAERKLQVEVTLTEKQKLYDFDYSNISALRDIKRIFNNRLMDLLSLR